MVDGLVKRFAVFCLRSDIVAAVADEIEKTRRLRRYEQFREEYDIHPDAEIRRIAMHRDFFSGVPPPRWVQKRIALRTIVTPITLMQASQRAVRPTGCSGCSGTRTSTVTKSNDKTREDNGR